MASDSSAPPPDANSRDLTELTAEIWILLPGAQVLTAFLILLPFNDAFDDVTGEDQPAFVVAFACALLSLVLFTAPAAHHAVHRPLLDVKDYKVLANRFMIAGMIPFGLSSMLVAHLVISHVVTLAWVSWFGTVAVVALIVGLWWVFPAWHRGRTIRERES